MCLSTISSGYPLSSKIFLMKSISCVSLLCVHFISALCTSVTIRLAFRFRGLKDFQRMYWPEKVGFRYTLDSKPSWVLSTRMSRNGSLPSCSSCSFSTVNLRAGCRRFIVTWKSSTSPSCLKMAKLKINKCWKHVENKSSIFVRKKIVWTRGSLQKCSLMLILYSAFLLTVKCISPFCRVHFSLVHYVFKRSCSPQTKPDRDRN